MDPVSRDRLQVPLDATLVVYAENQPGYIPLPVAKYPDGSLFCEWEPSDAENEALIDALVEGKKLRVRLWVWTFNQPLQPVRLEIACPIIQP